jgi:hypothetical protein
MPVKPRGDGLAGLVVSIPGRYTVGDSLKWDAPWIDVQLWVELPFWLMTSNATVTVNFDGHQFPVAIHDNYFELFFGEATDSRSSVGYRGPFKKWEDLSANVKEAMKAHPNSPYMWRKCKTYLKVGTRCNNDVWTAVHNRELPRSNEARLYLSELCRAHIPVVNRLIEAYRLATYDYFAFEVSSWDVPTWSVERGGDAASVTLLGYRAWDSKPLIGKLKDPSEKPKVYQLIEPNDFQQSLALCPSPGEPELLDALNLMETGDYSGAVRRITTAIEVIVEAVTAKAVEGTQGKQAAEKFLRDTRMHFIKRLKTYQELTGRTMTQATLRTLNETRELRHSIVHGGRRIGPGDRGAAQKAVDIGRWTFNWLEDDRSRRDVRERRIAFRSLGRELYAGVFPSRITPDGVIVAPIPGGPPKERT